MTQIQKSLPLAQRPVDPQLRQAGWLRLSAAQTEQLAAVQNRYGIDLSLERGRAAIEEAGCVLVPVEMVIRQERKYQETCVLFVLGKDLLISVEQDVHLEALDLAGEQLLQAQRTGIELDPATMLFTIIEVLNDAARAAVGELSEQLDARSEAVAVASGGFEMSKRQAGVADIAGTAIALGEAEELVARMVEGQLMLARAGRWLRRFSDNATLAQGLSMLLSDIHSLRRYARFQHDKIRNLQQSLMTTLDLKQNQVIKVFTVVTAVFTPPTLLAAFYGQNFAYMPELELVWGEWLVMGLTGFFSLMPLFYIKRKGWMR
ncbi:MAG: CorA family divalent cation transporter [Castellaniella sp.]|uniref:magnesium transporter CorA family protein n=1 Tax=Castellaniella sp. TaxID=1955812 RepID=UPI002A35E6EA|nr:CorA family divalent cation transporter [Castellaniella sp.]MDY0308844.1 CorA family divalent cation transporter [Castellaniella sp.]